MHEPQITVIGNVARPPKLRTVASGALVADFRLACTPRRQDKASGDWSDGQTLWFGITCWRSLADNTAASLQTGDRVVVTGRLATRSWTGDDGVERSGLEIEASSIGLDLSRGTATLKRSTKPSAAQDLWASSGESDPTTGLVFAVGDEPATTEERAA